MALRTLGVLATLALPLAARAAASPSATATLKNAEGKDVGHATFASVKGGVKIQVTAAGLSPGKHGIHLHAVGKCDPPDFKSAGAHFNPGEKHHGLQNPEGPHAGDLPNLSIGNNGKGKGAFTLKGVTLAEGKGSLLGPEGAAIVIHAAPDDQKTDPAGNSGDRVACGVIQRK